MDQQIKRWMNLACNGKSILNSSNYISVGWKCNFEARSRDQKDFKKGSTDEKQHKDQ